MLNGVLKFRPVKFWYFIRPTNSQRWDDDPAVTKSKNKEWLPNIIIAS